MPARKSDNKLRVATCQFSETYQPRRNAAVIRRYIAAAARMRADVVHFHEGALSGYGEGVVAKDYDWAALREATQSVLDQARDSRMWVVVSSAHRLTGSRKPHNSLYLVSPQGKVVDRYDKRFCMAEDLKWYTPGDHYVTFDLKGIRCGLLICFDLRFPELYRVLLKKGVRVVFQSFNNGRMDGPGIHEHIMRQTVQAQAAFNSMWISAANSSAYYSRWGSAFIRPDGLISGSLPRNRAGIMVSTVDPSEQFYDPLSRFRNLAMDGTLHTGKCVKDPRSRNRQSF